MNLSLLDEWCLRRHLPIQYDYNTKRQIFTHHGSLFIIEGEGEGAEEGGAR